MNPLLAGITEECFSVNIGVTTNQQKNFNMEHWRIKLNNFVNNQVYLCENL